MTDSLLSKVVEEFRKKSLEMSEDWIKATLINLIGEESTKQIMNQTYKPDYFGIVLNRHAYAHDVTTEIYTIEIGKVVHYIRIWQEGGKDLISPVLTHKYIHGIVHKDNLDILLKAG